MDARELRIGNWVKFNGGWCWREIDKGTEFQWDDSDWYKHGECCILLEDIDPIPLTEEWLLNFGFEYWDNKSLYFEAIPNVLKFMLYPIKDSDEFEVHWDHNWITSIKYVHSLQNLYFALMRKELEIKDK